MIARLILSMLMLALAATPALSGEFAYVATLRGDNTTTNTGSSATGRAVIVVHFEAQTVDLILAVKGLAMADLSEHLSHAPVGPVHLHIYAANGDSSLLLPFPMGPGYAATAEGFELKATNYPYADGAKIIASDMDFGAFIRVLDSGAVVLNIHSQKFPDGEISGKLMRAALTPAAPAAK
jgi:hypothetical protein